ncbi:MAG: glycoside hydrolase family 65 protein, partial [Calditrichia bacterium]
MTDWKLVYDKWIPEQQPLREALCTLGNGYFATRGAEEEVKAGKPHYPGTYLAGGYNRMESEVAGRVIENEVLVNWPNWLYLNFRPENGGWFTPDSVKILDYVQELDIQNGILERRIRFRDDKDRQTLLVSRRIVHMENPHLAAIEWTLTPENWSGRICIHSALDGKVINAGVKRYSQLNQNHLEPLETGREGEDGIFLRVETRQSHIQMVQAARTQAYYDSKPITVERKTVQESGYVAQELSFECEKHRTIRVEKVVTIYTSRDDAISEPGLDARKELRRAGLFAELLESHKRAWSTLWHRVDIDINKINKARLILRLHIFHLIQTTSMNTIDLDVGVPSRGLHGEAYRGHIFWDELFIFPFLNLRMPELTRTLLMYRYRRLGEARHAAQEAGFKGAMFPWQSGSNGREENQILHLNPKSGKWDPDNTYLQRHVNAAIAYNVWQYYQAADDMEFLSFYGAEMILCIAHFWSSIAVYNPDRDRYEIRGVVGPDEYHTQ